MPENRFLSTCAVLLLALFPSLGVIAQTKLIVHGDVVANISHGPLSQFEVEVASTTDRLTIARAQVSGDGSFRLSNIDAGLYQLRVLGVHGEQVYDALVSLHDGAGLTLHLPVPNGSRAAAAKVSVAELAHPTPAKATKEYLRAKKASAAGNRDESITHFKRAIEIHPGFVPAWNDLGVVYMNQSLTAEALECFQRAADLEPASPLINANLSVTLCKLGRFQESERYARRALAADRDNQSAKQALAFSLAFQSRAKREP